MSASRSSRKLWLGGGATLLLALCAGVAWTWFRPAEGTARSGLQEAPAAVARFESIARVRAAPVRRMDLSLRKEATGYLEPWRLVEVSAETSGRVVERAVGEGQRVEAGKLLVRLDDREALLAVQEAQAERLKSRALYAVNYESSPAETSTSPEKAEAPSVGAGSAEHLFSQGLISKQDLADARRRETEHLLAGNQLGEVRAASSGLAQAEQRLSRARLALERTRLYAPFGGRVSDLAVEPGQQIAPGTPLFTLLDDNRLKVDVSVLEADIVRLREGAPARVRIPALDGTTLEGTVHTINPRVDPKTGTGRVTVILPNPRGRLMPGLFTYVELETSRLLKRLLVPVSAVLERQDRQLVFRIAGGKALWTYVETGARSGDLIEIVEGLAEGDLVAVSDHFALAHEAPVEVVE